MPTANTRDELRRRMRALRRALTDTERLAAARCLAIHVTASRLFLASRRIACYLPNDGEIDPGFIVERIARMNKTCYLPVLSRLASDRLWFAPYTDQTLLDPNRFGIPEPRVPAGQLVRATQLDLILVPLVAFDGAGNRLGMGGGFYDRSLEFLRHRHRWRKPHLVGLAYDFQRVDGIAHEPWDVPLAAIATERGLHTTPAQ